MESSSRGGPVKVRYPCMHGKMGVETLVSGLAPWIGGLREGDKLKSERKQPDFEGKWRGRGKRSVCAQPPQREGGWE